MYAYIFKNMLIAVLTTCFSKLAFSKHDPIGYYVSHDRQFSIATRNLTTDLNLMLL